MIYSTGIAFAAQNKRAEALEVIKQLEGMSGPELAEAQYIARIYAALNDKEMALDWLERGLATGAIGFFYKDDPMWDSIGARRVRIAHENGFSRKPVNSSNFFSEPKRRNVHDTSLNTPAKLKSEL